MGCGECGKLREELSAAEGRIEWLEKGVDILSEACERLTERLRELNEDVEVPEDPNPSGFEGAVSDGLVKVSTTVLAPQPQVERRRPTVVSPKRSP